MQSYYANVRGRFVQIGARNKHAAKLTAKSLAANASDINLENAAVERVAGASRYPGLPRNLLVGEF